MNQYKKEAKKSLANLFGFFNFTLYAGWDKDKNGRKADAVESSYGGGAIRSTYGEKRDASMFEIIKHLQKSGRDILNSPIEHPNKELKRCADFIGLYGKKSPKWIKRATNLAKAILLVPMLNGDYKKEKMSTIKQKGFSRPSIDTGQTAKGIKAFYKKGK